MMIRHANRSACLKEAFYETKFIEGHIASSAVLLSAFFFRLYQDVGGKGHGNPGFLASFGGSV